MPEYTALEINSPKMSEIVKTLDPSLQELDFEKDLHGHFIVIGYPEPGRYSLVDSLMFDKHFDHIENGMRITLKQFITKE